MGLFQCEIHTVKAQCTSISTFRICLLGDALSRIQIQTFTKSLLLGQIRGWHIDSAVGSDCSKFGSSAFPWLGFSRATMENSLDSSSALNPKDEKVLEHETCQNDKDSEDSKSAVIKESGDGDKPNDEESSGKLSKRAQKRAERMLRRKERKEARKGQLRDIRAKKLIEKRQDRERALAHLTEAEREAELSKRKERLHAFRAEEREYRENVRKRLREKTKFNVCVDLGWNNDMSEKERKSLCRQLTYSYNSIRKCAEEGRTPFSLSICGLDDGMAQMLTHVASGWESWPLDIKTERLEDFHEIGRIVYLTHDATEVLDELDEKDVYVIGGIVDRNRLKGATMEKAKRLGVRAAKLNLDENVAITHGTPVLTVNHCVDILLNAANGMSWAASYLRVLPSRKGVKSVEQ